MGFLKIPDLTLLVALPKETRVGEATLIEVIFKLLF
jgi:hypothetical protein